MSKPSLSIVTPSFNQAKFVRTTLDSIAAQSVAPAEHLIYDGGSTDGTLEILRDYAKGNDRVVLEIGKDSGQANAINLGFARSSSDIIAWLNTDDWYIRPEVIAETLDFFAAHSEVDIVYSRGDFVSEAGKFLRAAFINTDASDLKNQFICSVGILQPALFLRRSVFTDIGPLIENMSYAFDFEYWVRALFNGKRFHFLDRKVCEATLHSDSKTMGQRDKSITEAGLVVRKHYGFTPYQWLDKAANAIVHQVDGIVRQNNKETPEKIEKRRQLMRQLNPTPRNIANAFTYAHHSAAQPTVRFFAEDMGLDLSKVVVTSFDTSFFRHGLTMIAGMHKHHSPAPPVFVYDLGLTKGQRGILESLKSVFVLDFPKEDFPAFNGYYGPATYGFKAFTNWHACHYVQKNGAVLWVDGGIYPLGDLSPVFRIIDEQGIFLVDHDDKKMWPFQNLTFASDGLIDGMEASNDELLAPHLRAGILGHKVKGKYAALFEAAFRYSLDPNILVGDKHPQPPVQRPRRNDEYCKRALTGARFRRQQTIAELREHFGYLGHRHDQTIYSVLAARYRAPHHSAWQYCVADEASSAASRDNWTAGGIVSGNEWSYQIPEVYRKSKTLMMQHRGTFTNFQGLKFDDIDTSRRAIVLGNGPSMKGFNFARFKGFDVFGMNVAYRYWDQIGWYPTYYSCLDTVVGLSHKEEIARLIEKSGEYGIRLFLLRDNLINQFGDFDHRDKVLNFDELAKGYEMLAGKPISTGSHTAAWAAILGYTEIFMLGIDCNYVEIVDGAVQGKGTELEIVEEKDNPNYFFDGYQRKGDKYNVPNPNPDKDIHLGSWHSVADAMIATESPSIILNANLQSKVDAFDFCLFEDVESSGPIRVIDRGEVLSGDALELGLWRDGMIRRFERNRHAHFDETDLIHQLFENHFDGGKDRVMLDVGAHFGESAAPYAASGWQIYCFEPDPENRERLARRFNNTPNVRIDPRAVAETASTKNALYRSAESTGISSLMPFHETHEKAATVDVTTIADVLADHSLTRIDFLKIDVEGSDFSVLKGVPWDKLSPQVILAEFEDSKTKSLGHTWRDIAGYLVDKGYAVFVSEWHPVIRYGVRHDWCCLKPYPCDLEDENAFGNLLAFCDAPSEDVFIRALRQILKVDKLDFPVYQPKKAPTLPAGYETAQSVATAHKKSLLDNPNLTPYVRFALTLQENSPVLFRFGQRVMRVLRALKRRPVFTGAFAAVSLGLIAAPLFSSALASFGGWYYAGLAVITALIAIQAVGHLYFERRARQTQNVLKANVTRELRRSNAQLLKKIEDLTNAQLLKKIEDLTNAQLLKKIEDLTKKVDQKGGQLTVKAESMQETIKQLHSELEAAASPVSNFAEYHTFSRNLKREDVRRLNSEWSEKLAISTTPKSIYYLAHRICMLELNMRGRLATNIEDAVLRTLVASAIRKPELRVLEIGTLFGIGLAMIYEYTRDRFERVHVTALDPLEGYYDKSPRDIITDELVNEAMLRRNLAIAGVPKEDFTLIKHLSTDEAAQQAARDPGDYNVLIIDGDHSYEGVKADYELYNGYVANGGFIIFDDYDTTDWPGVKQFVDEHVVPDQNMSFIGASWRTAVFRVTRQQATS